MPIYVYNCKQCGKNHEAFRHIDERHDSPECCGDKTTLKIVPTMLNPVLGGGDFQGYKCVVTDEYVTSRKRRREIMAEHNLVEAGDKRELKMPETKTTDLKETLQSIMN